MTSWEDMRYAEETGPTFCNVLSSLRRMTGLLAPYTRFVTTAPPHAVPLNGFLQENIPFQYRTIAGIAQFTQSLLASPSPSSSMHAVQKVWLPPHAHDKPGDIPKCKGFALITLSSPEQAHKLTRHWPWNVRRTDPHGVADVSETQEAIKFGFRTMLRARWDELQEEYLAYRRTLSDALAYVEEQHEATTDAPMVVTEEPAVPPAPSHLPTTDLWSLFPEGCLVFVRNIHPETNKTTLRSLFSQAFAHSDVSDEGVDYVDFSKGMDTVSQSIVCCISPPHTNM